MSDSVLGALISAVASILIAILNKRTSSSEGARAPTLPSGRGGARQAPGPSETHREIQQLSATGWYISFGVLLVWMALTPALIHHDLAGTNFFLIPIVAIVLAVIVPIPPLKAAWLCFAMFTANFVIGPLSNRLHGSAYDTTFETREMLTFVLSLAAATAVVTSLICFLRLKYKQHATIEYSGRAGAGLAAELEKLAQLRTAGVLSEAEFQRAKERLLAPSG